MSFSKTMRAATVIACFAAFSAFGQTTTTTTEKTTTKTTRKTGSRAGRTRVWNDATRLAAILSDVQNQRTTFTTDAWRVTANEANALANRVYAGAGGRSQARELRTHVRALRTAAMKGDAQTARSEASQALPFAYQLIDWAMPQESSSR